MLKKSSENGQTLVEFAILLPVLLFFLFGIMQFGVIFGGRIIASGAAKDGVRMAAVGKSDAEIQTAIIQKTSMMPFLNVDASSITVSPERVSRREDVDVNVSVSGDIDLVFPLINVILGNSHNFTSTASMRYELSVPYQLDTASDVYFDTFILTHDLFNSSNIEIIIAISDNYGNPIPDAYIELEIIDIFTEGNKIIIGGETGEYDGTLITTIARFGNPGPEGYDAYIGKILDINAGAFFWNGTAPEPYVDFES